MHDFEFRALMSESIKHLSRFIGATIINGSVSSALTPSLKQGTNTLTDGVFSRIGG
jgi:ethanolamine utilization microcompartment shell protein EutS